jgi:hypothetical protein
MFVDWAGATIPIHNRSTGEITQAPLFVATLGASSYTYAEAARNQQLDSWIQVNMHALEFYGGVPQLSVLFYTLSSPELRRPRPRRIQPHQSALVPRKLLESDVIAEKSQPLRSNGCNEHDLSRLQTV